MTVEIDDSGTGDIIGPAFILFWRRETNTLVKKEVPLELYQQKNFNTLTKEYIRELFKEVFQIMDIPPTEDIWLCTGPCFDEARKWLQENRYNYHDAKIEGYLQTQVESTYLDYLIENYDFPKEKAILESGKKRFFAIFNWVVDDFPRRIKFIKSGFDKWQSKWKNEAETLWMKKMVEISSNTKEVGKIRMNERIQNKQSYKSNQNTNHPSKSFSKKTNSKKRNKSYSTKISKSRKKYPKKKKTYSKTHQQASNSSKYKKDPMQKFY